jgi:hypothetical protein
MMPHSAARKIEMTGGNIRQITLARWHLRRRQGNRDWPRHIDYAAGRGVRWASPPVRSSPERRQAA